jgi:hypothetical protein
MLLLLLVVVEVLSMLLGQLPAAWPRSCMYLHLLSWRHMVKLLQEHLLLHEPPVAVACMLQQQWAGGWQLMLLTHCLPMLLLLLLWLLPWPIKLLRWLLLAAKAP